MLHKSFLSGLSEPEAQLIYKHSKVYSSFLCKVIWQTLMQLIRAQYLIGIPLLYPQDEMIPFL